MVHTVLSYPHCFSYRFVKYNEKAGTGWESELKNELLASKAPRSEQQFFPLSRRFWASFFGDWENRDPQSILPLQLIILSHDDFGFSIQYKGPFQSPSLFFGHHIKANWIFIVYYVCSDPNSTTSKAQSKGTYSIRKIEAGCNVMFWSSLFGIDLRVNPNNTQLGRPEGLKKNDKQNK